MTSDPGEVFRDATVAVNAIPTQFIRPTWTGLIASCAPGTPLVSTAKGIEEGTLLRPTEVLGDLAESTLGTRPELGVLSGPTIATELAERLPAALISASPTAAYDSWLTVGITDGDASGALGTIGIPFDQWTDTIPITVTDGAVFWMVPGSAPQAPGGSADLTVAQLTVAAGSSGCWTWAGGTPQLLAGSRGKAVPRGRTPCTSSWPRQAHSTA